MNEQKITPFLWFEKGAEEAANFYVDLFNNNPGKKLGAELGTMSRYDENSAKASGQPAGSVMVIAYQLEGQEFTAINGGPYLKMTGGVSFIIDCKDQKEVDYFWEKLSSDGGEAGQCGWINHDKFGVTWQVVPSRLNELIGDPDSEKAGRAMQAMLKMTKIDIAELEKAADIK